MRCQKCGHDNEAGKRFCTSCGAKLEPGPTEAITLPDRPTEPIAAATPPPGAHAAPPVRSTPAPTFAAPPAGAVTPRRSRKYLFITIAVVVVLLLVGGGVLAWFIVDANRTIARVEALNLSRADGGKVDPGKVPLDDTLNVEAFFVARFKSGKARLEIYVVASDDTRLVSETYDDIRSSSSRQSRKLEFHMTQSTGREMEARADLKIDMGGQKVALSTGTLTYTPVKGKGKAAQLEDAKKASADKLSKAKDAVAELVSMGIESNDLAAQLSEAVTRLEQAKTADQADAEAAVADTVIAECGARKAAAEAGEQAVAICRANQATLKAAIRTFYATNGNFPDQLSMLVRQGFLRALPVCPSGGTYEYQADLFIDPPGLTVYCTVHGSL